MELNFSNLTISDIWSGFGLLMDVVGVLFLGWAFFSKSFKDIRKESGTYVSYNSSLFYNLLDQKASGVVGTVALLIGFIQQFIVNIPVNTSVSPVNLFLVLFCFNFVVIVFILIYRRYYVLFYTGKMKIVWDENLNKQLHTFRNIIKIGKEYEKEIRMRFPPDKDN
jgi:hypothetical protein